MRYIFLSSSALVFSVFIFLVFPHQNVHAALQGSITIEQISPSTLGVWSLQLPDQSIRKSSDRLMSPRQSSFTFTDFGLATLFVEPPVGMSVRLLVYNSGTLSSVLDSRQFTFTLHPNDQFRFVVQYALTSVGSLGVTTSPNGVPLLVTGPDKTQYTAVSPYTFTNLPAGEYLVQAQAIPGYLAPAPYSRKVEPSRRVVLRISLPKDVSVSGSQSDSPFLDQSPDRLSKRALRAQAFLREQLRAASRYR